MSNFTPGPWKARCMGSEGSIVWMDGKDIEQHFRLGMIADCTSRPFTESKANALLIAAAPELLEACKLNLNALKQRFQGDDFGIRNYVQPMEQAIAKAEGKEA